MPHIAETVRTLLKVFKEISLRFEVEGTATSAALG